jgi:hypothetical protein
VCHVVAGHRLFLVFAAGSVCASSPGSEPHHRSRAPKGSGRECARLALPPYLSKRHLGPVGSLMLRFARAGRPTTTVPLDG